MKKLLLFLLVILTCVSILASCEQINKITGKGSDKDSVNTDETPSETPDDTTDETPDDTTDETPDDKPNDDGPVYVYNDFTPTEKNIFINYLGEVLPFAPTNEYYVEGYYDIADYENGINYYTVGNTVYDFESYRELYADFEFVEAYQDDDGHTWFNYTKGSIVIDMSFYPYEGENYIDVFAYVDDGSTDNPGNGGSDNTGDNGNNNGGNENGYTYTDFTDAEKQLIISMLGELIPFIPNNEYYVEEYYDEYYESDCISYYTFGNSQTDFNNYRSSLVGYTLVDSFEDSYGDMWYCYEKGDVYIEVSFYYYDGDYVVDLYAFGPGSGSGDNGGSGNNGGNNGGSTTNDDVITNAGAGLPEGTNGVYDIDFTDATNVKDVTDQGYYLDGCPTTGSPAVLVIPVEFSDATASSKGYSISNIVTAFTGVSGTTDYYSVYEYYYISSGGKLDLEITILDEWFRPSNNSSYYKNYTYNYYGDTVSIGDQLIIDEALDYLDDFMDLSKYDSDNNGIIDAIVIINTLDVSDSSDFTWAYRYWNIYTNSNGYYYEYDGVSANDYLWASYQFMQESYDANGETYYDASAMNTYTYIHEFAHILGVDDYYDTSYEEHPLDGIDIMDAMTGDHNAYTKFNLGWITSSRLVTTDSSVTLTLDAFSKNGDTIIIANNFDPTLGVYQEYYIVVYYTNDGLNAGDDYGYFARDGIVVYHVNASLFKEISEGETYYDVYNNNTSASDNYGTENNLIEFVKSSEGNYTYVEGDSLPTVTDDLGKTLGYTFTVDSLTEDSATITFTKK